MSISIADLVRQLAAAGATPEAIAIAVDAVEQTQREFQATEEARKKGQRNRTRKSRDGNVTVTGQDVTVTSVSRDTPSPPCPPIPPSSPSNSPNNPLTPLNSLSPLSIASQSQGGRAATRPAGSEESGSPIEKRSSRPKADCSAERAAGPWAVDKAFDEFWREYPRRDGANPKQPAAKKFAAALKSGTTPEVILVGARRYRAECDEKKITGTSMVAQALTWLNQQRWSDYAAQAPPPPDPEPTPEQLERRQRMIEEGERILNGDKGIMAGNSCGHQQSEGQELARDRLGLRPHPQ